MPPPPPAAPAGAPEGVPAGAPAEAPAAAPPPPSLARSTAAPAAAAAAAAAAPAEPTWLMPGSVVQVLQQEVLPGTAFAKPINSPVRKGFIIKRVSERTYSVMVDRNQREVRVEQLREAPVPGPAVCGKGPAQGCPRLVLSNLCPSAALYSRATRASRRPPYLAQAQWQEPPTVAPPPSVPQSWRRPRPYRGQRPPRPVRQPARLHLL
eukprot:Transcript_17836.p1 GENE.Transcript_17836~~Transcript_17836.p1  ORF type:complete len:208 (+),score=5.75 Transcript_17836:365-988(+)